MVSRFISYFMTVSFSFLVGIAPCYAAEFESLFETQHSLKVTSFVGLVSPPSVVSNFWKSSQHIHFENGLLAFYTTVWNHESQAKQKSSFKIEGNVNIFPEKISNGYSIFDMEQYCDFVLIEERFGYVRIPIDLWLDKKAKFNDLAKIKTVKENIQETKSRKSKKKKRSYNYIIELDDGSTWKTEPKDKQEPWILVWKEGSEVIKLGNSKRFCLINKTKVEQKEYSSIRAEDHILVYSN